MGRGKGRRKERKRNLELPVGKRNPNNFCKDEKLLKSSFSNMLKYFCIDFHTLISLREVNPNNKAV